MYGPVWLDRLLWFIFGAVSMIVLEELALIYK